MLNEVRHNVKGGMALKMLVAINLLIADIVKSTGFTQHGFSQKKPYGIICMLS